MASRGASLPASDVPGEVTSRTQPIPTVVPPFARQGMTVKDMYTGFMKPEEKAWWIARLTKARTGFYTPPAVGVDTIDLPRCERRPIVVRHRCGSDQWHGLRPIERYAVDPQASAGRRIHGRECGWIDSESPAHSALQGKAGVPTTEQLGRALYEQHCQICHGPELKGDRGPEIDTAVSRLGADGSRKVIINGRGGHAGFFFAARTIDERSDGVFGRPDLAPPGSAPASDSLWFARAAEQLHIQWLEDLIPSIRALVISYSEPPYPKGVVAPPSRYKTGYGNEEVCDYPAVDHPHRLRSEYRQNQMADPLWRRATRGPKRQDAGKCISQERVCGHRRRTRVICQQRRKVVRLK